MPVQQSPDKKGMEEQITHLTAKVTDSVPVRAWESRQNAGMSYKGQGASSYQHGEDRKIPNSTEWIAEGVCM